MEQEKDMDADRKLPCGPEKDIGYYIKRINDKLKAGFDAYLCDVDLTSSQARVIEYVYWNGGMVTQKEIEVFLDVAHPTVVGIVNRLEKKGYLNCHLDENRWYAAPVKLKNCSIKCMKAGELRNRDCFILFQRMRWRRRKSCLKNYMKISDKERRRTYDQKIIKKFAGI